MISAVRALVVPITIAVLGVAACQRRDSDRTGEPVSSTEDEVEALDPALASRLPPGATLDVAEEGRRLFPVCTVCHGVDAGGTELGPPLNDAEWIGISGDLTELEEVIREGVAEPQQYPIPMPVLGGGDFNDEQIRALATYVYVISRGTP